MTYARVVVDVAPAHLDRPFDYVVPDGMAVAIGSRVRVVFNGRARAGWVVGVEEEPSATVERVREIDRVDGSLTWFDEDDLPLFRWVADRYAGTVADVLRHALPQRVAAVGEEGERSGDAAEASGAARPPWAPAVLRSYEAGALPTAPFAEAGAGGVVPPV